jgi:phage tail sheath protein FI
VDFSLVDDASLATLKTDIDADADALVDANLSGDAKKLAEGKRNALKDLNTHLTATPAKDAGAKGATGGAPTPTAAQVHNSLMQVSPRYKKLMGGIRKLLNLQPPSAAMAGVYTRVDNFQGVFKAPANTGIMSVLSPCLEISHEEQEDLNAPLNGKAVNAIRSFVGQGVLIWGARTLDGNSQDWRYINVRRTIIMLEQSIKNAARAYVFQANNSSTWVTMRSMISNFLVNQWKAGALVGATPEEAFSVDVGLGSTMTADDILNGFMRITVKVALVRPAEFIVITFQQKMQTS